MDITESQSERQARAVPPDCVPKIEAIGKMFRPDAVVPAMEALYTPILERRVPTGDIEVTKDIAYGPDAERHLLDFHAPKVRAGSPMPAVIFFHGGGFVQGAKNENHVVHGNVANYFVRHGILGLNATYRLAPNVKWPDGARDIGTALAWAKANVASFGGDPENIYLMGHSAGASHVATYVFRPDVHPEAGPGCAGAILCSGGFGGPNPDNPSPPHLAYYGEDKAKYSAMGILGNVGRADFPVFISVAEYDPASFETAAFALMHELSARHGVSPRFKQVLGHNHISEIYSLDTGDPSLGPDLLDFVRRGG